MHHIAIISASVRSGRKSHRVALYLKKYLEASQLASVEIIDLAVYNFPVFDERLSKQDAPSGEALKFGEHIKNADGLIVVTPEYNGGYPASLKNVIDLLYDEWKRKPVALAPVSSGPFGGSQVTTSLLFTLWKIGAWVVPVPFQTSNVAETFNDEGVPKDSERMDRRVKRTTDELLWAIDARAKMNR